MTDSLMNLVIGIKRGHSYATVSDSSETGTSQNNSALDISDNFNWASFGSDQNHMDNTSEGTLSTFIHDVSVHSGSNHSHCTKVTWLGSVSFHVILQLHQMSVHVIYQFLDLCFRI